MESRTIKDKEHCVYTPEEFAQSYPDIEPKYWKDLDVVEGDWVRSDDGHIVQILRKKPLKQKYYARRFNKPLKYYIRTVVGTFIVHRHDMDTDFSKHVNRYVIGKSRKPLFSSTHRTNLSKAERRFVLAYLATRGDYIAAYKLAYKAKTEKYITKRALLLLSEERIYMAVKETVTAAFGQLGAEVKTIVGGIMDMAKNSKIAPRVRLDAWKLLADMQDLWPEQTKTAGGYMGMLEGMISPKELEEASYTELGVPRKEAKELTERAKVERVEVEKEL